MWDYAKLSAEAAKRGGPGTVHSISSQQSHVGNERYEQHGSMWESDGY